MTTDPSDEIDDILNEVLPEDAASGEVTDSSAPDFTMGQSVSKKSQISIINGQIESLADTLNVPAPAANLANSLCDQYREQRGNLYGTALELVATSCLYCACKVTEVPLDPTDFDDATGSIVTRRGLLRRSKDIATTIGLDPSAFFGSRHYVDRYCDELDVTTGVRDRAHEIVDTTEEMGISGGKSPSGWAAAAVYNACLDRDDKRTQSQIADTANVTEVTIRNRYQEQRMALRGSESPLSEPTEILTHIDSISEVDPAVRDGANTIIATARDSGLPVDDHPMLWTLAALRRASEIIGQSVSWKTLSQFTDQPSDELQQRRKKLREIDNSIRFELNESTTGS